MDKDYPLYALYSSNLFKTVNPFPDFAMKLFRIHKIAPPNALNVDKLGKSTLKAK